MKKHFTLSYACPKDDAVSKLSEWLSVRSVKYTISDGEITSSKIPIPIVSWDGRQYSQDNWIGINPFLFFDKLKIDLCSSTSGNTKVRCSATSYRFYIPIIFWIFIAIASWHDSGIIENLIIGAGLIIYCLFVNFGVFSSALRSEIEKAETQKPTLKPRRF